MFLIGTELLVTISEEVSSTDIELEILLLNGNTSRISTRGRKQKLGSVLGQYTKIVVSLSNHKADHIEYNN